MRITYKIWISSILLGMPKSDHGIPAEILQTLGKSNAGIMSAPAAYASRVASHFYVSGDPL